MGFLDKKTRIIDMCLTEKGRELLARNELRIAHYAFSDDLIDYSGSLSQSLAQSGSMDEVVYKNYVPVEASSMGGKGLTRDLQSFLFTCAEQRDLLPPFSTNVSGTINLNRVASKVYFFDLFTKTKNRATDNVDVVVITERDDTAAGDREAQYSAEQSLEKLDLPLSLLTKK
jgi:hypothetical protein